jgi:hypothetical protein
MGWMTINFITRSMFWPLTYIEMDWTCIDSLEGGTICYQNGSLPTGQGFMKPRLTLTQDTPSIPSLLGLTWSRNDRLCWGMHNILFGSIHSPSGWWCMVIHSLCPVTFAEFCRCFIRICLLVKSSFFAGELSSYMIPSGNQSWHWKMHKMRHW